MVLQLYSEMLAMLKVSWKLQPLLGFGVLAFRGASSSLKLVVECVKICFLPELKFILISGEGMHGPGGLPAARHGKGHGPCIVCLRTKLRVGWPSKEH